MSRNKADIRSGHIYRRYIKGLDNYEKRNGYALPQGTINAALYDVNTELMRLMIEKNQFLKLPYKLGTIGIFKYKPKLKVLPNGRLNLPIDMNATMKLWKDDPQAKENKKFVYHRNLHSGGYVAFFKWMKSGAKVKNIMGYDFNPVKGVKRALTKVMKDPLSKADFFEKKR